MKVEFLSAIGASSEFSLQVPDAKASPYTLYGPRGVFLKDNTLIVADTGNHRVLIWKDLPKQNQPADVVLGQMDFYSDHPNAGGDTERGLFLPTGVFVSDEGKLFVADAWNHRILLWDRVPEESFSKPDHVIGQPNLKQVDRNLFFWCFGVYYHGDDLYVCDTGNRRILKWKGIPDSMQKPDEVYEGFGWPHAICKKDEYFFVADAGTGVSKVYAFRNSLRCAQQADFYLGHGEGCGRFNLNLPYGVSANHRFLFVADTSNNRVLIFEEREPVAVLGQKDFSKCGENRWEGVYKDTLCWPYAVFSTEDLLLIADTGNNRVVLYSFNA